MLHAVPLQTLLDWLSKPKGPYLVEAPPAAAPDKALAIAINKQVLYGEVPPSRVQATLHFYGAIQCHLHAPACMACGWLQPGTREQTKYLMTHIHEHFRDE